MKTSLKLLAFLFVLVAFSATASAKSFYWTTVDRTSDGIYMNFRVVETTTEKAPTATELGKTIQVSSGPFTSRSDAHRNCEKSVKLSRSNGNMNKNLCTTVTKAK